MDLDWLKGLIELVEDSGVDGLDVELVGSETGDPTRVRIRKSPRVAAAVPAAAVPAAAVGSGEVAPTPAAAPDSLPAEAAPASGLFEVLSPMVGTFYRAPAADADPFVSVGDRVEAGQTLCILEAMKLMNELQSDVAGVVREIAVENAEPVEYGALLFRIEPD
ncbi:acetyl-CoA carboxylase biotin carboxyl carrier protein [Candidatus Palauibacter polyketidifaciens]|uniref:acetyl-CoA carboxylase biotin carboxyl carrier protein n=1 Tax=Candidatus Palauibacter polyketidifaciens TaxID=3056740 RepID=UPI0023842483|nr:acetyl-CoA carboxylase biotin carboxyl carrier protein [Candidatus Palauibacter polyketidifaciens]MDE2721029.1 acetyl-CoA carboxylase biotin carboxyl carrier protein [Candidatus Palauibacter polyketidifaciens]